MQPDIDIGPPLSVYQGRPLRWQDLFFVFIPATLAVLAPLGYGIWRAIYGYVHFGPIAARAWSDSWLLLASLATLALLGLALYRLYASGKFISIHENGLRIRFSPLSEHKYAWSEIAGISTASIQDRFLGFPIHTSSQVLIYPNLGKPVRLDKSFGNPKLIKEQVAAQIYPRMLPELRAGLQQGKWIYFGDLAIHGTALKVKDHLVPWDQIDSMSIESGFLVVKSEKSGLLRVPVSKIPNLDLLFHLADRHH
ncbi:MAG TPA: DUF6585 family protein [Anaerolineales bacterium]|jgi:hypothetical protein|nr:DUF6585 family protein [Anaerolineales bacterium]